MAQSNESNVRGIPSFWPNHTLEPPYSWTQWSDQFKVVIIAKKNLDEDSFNGPEVQKTHIQILGQPTGSESDTDKASREARDKNAMKENEAVKEKRINEKKKNSIGSDTLFIKPPNTTFERYKLLNRKQADRESFETLSRSNRFGEYTQQKGDR